MRWLVHGSQQRHERGTVCLEAQERNKKSLKKEVRKIATTITKKSNQSIKIGKLAFYRQLDMNAEKAYEYTSKVMTKNMAFNDAKEGIEAFIEKRNPNWKN